MHFGSRVTGVLRNAARAAKWKSKSLLFLATHWHLRKRRKLIYALTPPAHLSNVGDHAQAVAIHRWLAKHFADLPVIELDKDESRFFLSTLKKIVSPSDLIFLHSGGNLGDRGIYSEAIRRSIISEFPQNRIVSLPQTIYFSSSANGEREKQTSRQIYAQHSHLTVIGRDPRSGDLAKELFPRATSFCMPDFVLSLPPRQPGPIKHPPKILLCLRLDDESAITPDQRQAIARSLPYDCTFFDTTLPRRIARGVREKVLNETLALFSSADLVVTDRYHGLIFTILCRKPCVVLPTVDHKLTSAMHWFKLVPYVAFAREIADVPRLVEYGLAINERDTPDWESEYFDKIPHLVGA